VADVQPRLDSLLERLQNKINDLRKDLDERATRSSRTDVPAGELSAGPGAGAASAAPGAAPGETPPDEGPGAPGTMP
jgi:hypothetical protein